MGGGFFLLITEWDCAVKSVNKKDKANQPSKRVLV